MTHLERRVLALFAADCAARAVGPNANEQEKVALREVIRYGLGGPPASRLGMWGVEVYCATVTTWWADPSLGARVASLHAEWSGHTYEAQRQRLLGLLDYLEHRESCDGYAEKCQCKGPAPRCETNEACWCWCVWEGVRP